MVAEILEEVSGRKFMLKEADNIKFLSLINPLQTATLTFELTCRSLPGEEMTVNSVASGPDSVYLKLKARFIPDPGV
jgi:hypothetical protein